FDGRVRGRQRLVLGARGGAESGGGDGAGDQRGGAFGSGDGDGDGPVSGAGDQLRHTESAADRQLHADGDRRQFPQSGGGEVERYGARDDVQFLLKLDGDGLGL